MPVQLVPFQTECEELADGSVRLSAHGELDLATAAVFGEALSECVRDRPRHVVVDLADVPFIDASGLRVIIDARDRQQAAGGDFLISRPSRQVVRVLEIAGSRAELPIAAE